MKNTYYVLLLLLLAALALILGFLFGFNIDLCEDAAEAATAETAIPIEEQPAAVKEDKPYTDKELETLALLIYQEAGGDSCTDETRLMVGTVALNRVADPRFPDTLEEVALQRSQYGRLHWTGLVWPERASKEIEAHAVQRAYDCAAELLGGVRALPKDVIFQAEFIQGSEIVAYQDGFYFCR